MKKPKNFMIKVELLLKPKYLYVWEDQKKKTKIKKLKLVLV